MLCVSGSVPCLRLPQVGHHHASSKASQCCIRGMQDHSTTHSTVRSLLENTQLSCDTGPSNACTNSSSCQQLVNKYMPCMPFGSSSSSCNLLSRSRPSFRKASNREDPRCKHGTSGFHHGAVVIQHIHMCPVHTSVGNCPFTCCTMLQAALQPCWQLAQQLHDQLHHKQNHRESAPHSTVRTTSRVSVWKTGFDQHIQFGYCALNLQALIGAPASHVPLASQSATPARLELEVLCDSPEEAAAVEQLGCALCMVYQMRLRRW
jgi:hypothetical protein